MLRKIAGRGHRRLLLLGLESSTSSSVHLSSRASVRGGAIVRTLGGTAFRQQQQRGQRDGGEIAAAAAAAAPSSHDEHAPREVRGEASLSSF